MAYSQLLLVLFTASNLISYLHASYVGTPATTDNLKIALKQSFEFKCTYTGSDDNGQFFEWYKDDTTVSQEKPGHYLVKTKEKESILIIQIFVEADANVTNWYVKTNKVGYEEPPQCRFGGIALKPSPQSIVTNRQNEKFDSAHGSVRRNGDESVLLTCIIKPKPEITSPGDKIRWEFSKDDQSFSSKLPGDVIIKDNEISIDHVKKAQRGYYRCVLNDVSFTVFLRVKDRLAALWPFIGIVSVVLILVVIILILEKRNKSNKKPTATDDDEQDQANDPLVKTKASDSDNKKRAVKA